MKVTKVVCDKCKNEINGLVYTVSVGFVGDQSLNSIMNMPKYMSYELCGDCLKDVITEDVKGSPYMCASKYTTYDFSPAYCV